MKLVQLKISPEQVRKLRKMQPIKINPKHKCISGSGVNLIVNEDTYNHLSKKFDTNRGLLFKLSQTEVDANKDLSAVEDEDVKEVMTGNGLFKHKKAKKAIKHIVSALEDKMKPETTGAGLIKSVKKGIKKATKKAVKSTKNVVKDVIKDVKDEAKEELKKTIKKVRNQAKKAVPEEMKETIDLVKKSVKAVLQINIQAY